MVTFLKYTCTALISGTFCKIGFPPVGSLHKAMFAVYLQVFSFDPRSVLFE